MTRPTYRLARKRALEKAGFVHVQGWVPAKQAAAVQRKIDAAAADVEAAVKSEKRPTPITPTQSER